MEDINVGGCIILKGNLNTIQQTGRLLATSTHGPPTVYLEENFKD